MQNYRKLLDDILSFSDDGVLYVDKYGILDIYHDSYVEGFEGRALGTIRDIKDGLSLWGIDEESDQEEIAEFFKELVTEY